ncbi:hypothetical protein BESB_012720 [Besnoitia besnoiti]|uniref:Uncharacterized protein n=1 Tax=Besnoitia besnoiti TaxID=94643 RepID=A0A2A9MB97_BESBE|nr:hypothetical protein BESB_012720 [Besnoitia besnoiti]PFH32660.1 hypothetical protein BESB_012720 [Besnoitia besnoiti]
MPARLGLLLEVRRRRRVCATQVASLPQSLFSFSVPVYSFSPFLAPARPHPEASLACAAPHASERSLVGRRLKGRAAPAASPVSASGSRRRSTAPIRERVCRSVGGSESRARRTEAPSPRAGASSPSSAAPVLRGFVPSASPAPLLSVSRPLYAASFATSSAAACVSAPAACWRAGVTSFALSLSQRRAAPDWVSAMVGKLKSSLATKSDYGKETGQKGTAAATDPLREHGLFGVASAIEQKASAFLSRLTDAQQRQLEKQGLLVSRFYRYLIISLMEKEGVFTFYDFYVWRKGCLEYLKAAEEEMQGIVGKSARKLADLGWEKLRPSTSPEFKEMELHLKILSHFTPEELSRDTAQHFTSGAIKNIAKAADTTVKNVKNVLLGHAIALTDRTWYMRLMEMRRPIPQTVEDYLLLAEIDRPYMIRLPYGERFFNYELEEALKKQRAANRYKSQRDVPRLGRRQHRVRRLFVPNERVAYDRWARMPQARLDAYGNFLFRLHQEPKGAVARARAAERAKQRAAMEADAECYSDAALSASRITLNNLPPGAFRRRTGMVRKSGEIHHLAPPEEPELREIFAAAVQREKDEKRKRELLMQENADTTQRREQDQNLHSWRVDGGLWG